MSHNNPRHKLNTLQVEDARKKYEDFGWRTTWIAMFHRVHRSSILFYVRKEGWIRRIAIIDRIPDDVVEMYRQKKKLLYADYDERRLDKKEKKAKAQGRYSYFKTVLKKQHSHAIEDCHHVRWIKRCSICGEILASDHLEHGPVKTLACGNATGK